MDANVLIFFIITMPTDRQPHQTLAMLVRGYLAGFCTSLISHLHPVQQHDRRHTGGGVVRGVGKVAVCARVCVCVCVGVGVGVVVCVVRDALSTQDCVLLG